MTARLHLSHLLPLRLAVARHGEMDNARWWNTNGLLGPLGATTVSRGLPRTHGFSRARASFAVAAARCRELYHPPNAVTLWDLPAEVEEAFDDAWHDWLDAPEQWQPTFERIAAHRGGDLLDLLRDLELLDPVIEEEVARLRRSAEGRAVPLGARALDERTLALLAAAFAKGESGRLAVPFATLETSAGEAG